MSLNGTVWTPIGPSPISEGGTLDNGMVTAIAVHPYNPSIIYIGSAGGGVWRTRDGGATWMPLFDRQPALGIGEPAGVAIDPNNTDIIYVGTSQRVMLGSGNTGIFGLPDSSQGLFKSTDGGNSWIQLGSGFPVGNTGNAINLVGADINVIIVDPANSHEAHAEISCARADVCNVGSWRQLQRIQYIIGFLLGIARGITKLLGPSLGVAERVMIAGLLPVFHLRRGGLGRGRACAGQK
jgi:hypothetical protein